MVFSQRKCYHELRDELIHPGQEKRRVSHESRTTEPVSYIHLYIGEERKIDEDTVEAIKRITRPASQRIIQAAFEYAAAHQRKKVTCVHKANILKQSDGLFLRVFREIAAQYPQIEATDLIVDNACMQMVMHPEQFDVMVMPNLYGDIPVSYTHLDVYKRQGQNYLLPQVLT